jgi:hypothetical protein
MESEQRAGRKEAARVTAGEYARRYPNGPHARLAARLASP